MGKRGRVAIRASSLKKARRKTPATPKLKRSTNLRKFRAVKRGVDVYIKKTNVKFSRKQPVKPGGFNSVANQFKKDGKEFFTKNVKRARRIVNARLTLSFTDKNGKKSDRVINLSRIKTNNPKTFRRLLNDVIRNAEKAIKKYDVRKSVKQVYVKGFSFECKKGEKKIAEKSQSTKSRPHKKR